MRAFLLVGMGGFAGALLRFYIAGWIQAACHSFGFPMGTLSVNMVGCLVLGFLGGISEHLGAIPQDVRLMIMVGLLGSFTTFSTFSYETMTLLRDQEILFALTNIGVQVIVGLLAAWFGFILAHQL